LIQVRIFKPPIGCSYLSYWLGFDDGRAEEASGLLTEPTLPSFHRANNKKTGFSLKNIFKRQKTLPEFREIQIGGQEQKFLGNSVSTAKYNVATFLPKFLFEEFSKSANLFFLFISGIQVRAKGSCFESCSCF
jgi:phospholipid-transporting ATPase